MLMPILICALAVGANTRADSNAPAHRRLFNPRIWAFLTVAAVPINTWDTAVYRVRSFQLFN